MPGNKPPPGAAYAPVDCDLPTIHALKALQRGDPSPDECKRALDWIINDLCATYDLPYRPGGEDGRRDTEFACGRMFVGRQIVKQINLTHQQLEGMKHGRTGTRSRARTGTGDPDTA